MPQIALGAEEPGPGHQACPVGHPAMGKVRGGGVLAEQGEGAECPARAEGLQGEILPLREP